MQHTSNKSAYTTVDPVDGLLVQFWMRPEPTGKQKYTAPRKAKERRFRSYKERDRAIKQWEH